MKAGHEVWQALVKPMTIMELWRTTNLPFRRVQDHVHRVLKPAGKICAVGKRGYYTLYARSKQPNGDAKMHRDSGRFQGDIRPGQGDLRSGSGDGEGEAA